MGTLLKKTIGVCLLACLLFAGCTPNEKEQEQKEKISVAVLKGPTGVGALGLLDKNSKGETKQSYDFTVASSPDQAMAGLINGDYQIAALPTNVAAALYQKTEGDVLVAAINTLGVLYVLEQGDTLHRIQDLAGKTIYATGQGATPEYVLHYLLENNNITDVTIEYMKDHAELAAAFAAGTVEYALLPEPNVTSVLLKNSNARIALDFNKEWKAVASDSALAMGCIAVRKDFYETNPQALQVFLEEYKDSVVYVEENLQQSAALAEQYEVIPNQAAAMQAIPNCSIVFIEKEEMKEKLQGFYEILFQANPQSVGGKLPDEAFYITE